MRRIIDMNIGESGEVCWIAYVAEPDLSFLMNKKVSIIAKDVVKCGNKTYAMAGGAAAYVGCKQE